ncbi:MAG: hypothetical protein D6805_03850 [Planctomycetota bacterium]|nr:MAG: hypothetical protein D6805_03850 [Planctomycetota bacterium]
MSSDRGGRELLRIIRTVGCGANCGKTQWLVCCLDFLKRRGFCTLAIKLTPIRRGKEGLVLEYAPHLLRGGELIPGAFELIERLDALLVEGKDTYRMHRGGADRVWWVLADELVGQEGWGRLRARLEGVKVDYLLLEGGGFFTFMEAEGWSQKVFLVLDRGEGDWKESTHFWKDRADVVIWNVRSGGLEGVQVDCEGWRGEVISLCLAAGVEEEVLEDLLLSGFGGEGGEGG